MADADRLVAALRYQQEMEDANRPVTVNPLMARKAEAIKQNAPAENMLTQYAQTMPQNWQQFGQNMAQAYPTPATGGTRDQIMAAVMQAAINAGPGITKMVAPQEQALRLAQQRAALPVEQHGLGLPANNTPQQRAAAMFPESGYHLSRHGADVKNLDSGVFAIAPFDAVGTHIGTKEAMQARWDSLAGRHPSDVKGVTYPVRFASQNPMFNADGKPFAEFDLTQNLMNRHNYDNGAGNYRGFNAQSRNDIFKDFTSIPYVNDVEAAGSISHIVPPDNIRSRFAAFDPWRRNSALAALLGVAAPDLLAQENK